MLKHSPGEVCGWWEKLAKVTAVECEHNDISAAFVLIQLVFLKMSGLFTHALKSGMLCTNTSQTVLILSLSPHSFESMQRLCDKYNRAIDGIHQLVGPPHRQFICPYSSTCEPTPLITSRWCWLNNIFFGLMKCNLQLGL